MLENRRKYMLNKKRLKLVVSKKWLVLLIGIAPLHFSNAQKLAIKSNVLSDLTLSPNLGLELVANSKLSFGLNYTFRPSDFPLDQMSFTVINPHMKYWSQRPLCRFLIVLDVLYLDNAI